MDKREITHLSYGKFELPNYTLKPEGLVRTDKVTEINFMQTTRNEDGSISEKQDGLIIESVLEMTLQRLKELNQLQSDRYTSISITKVEEAIWALQERGRDRIQRGVINTINK
jgi:hypothetical protein